LNVSAKDKATGKQQSIVIKASSGLAEEEIERMVKDAEAHAEEDRRFHETVAARNQADNLIHATEKSLKELGDKVDADERGRIDGAIAELREAMKGDDKDAIEAKTASLTDVAGKLAERVYAQEQDTANEQQQPGSRGTSERAASSEDVVDAEFEEVDDNKR
jgi:molecular chaperone DnaK